MNNLNNNRVNNHARAFFTVCNNNGENHSASCSVVRILKQFNHHAFILRSLADGRLMKQRAEMIALFDSDCVGDAWIESDKWAPGTPSWAYELSTGPCIIICHECVVSSSRMLKAVREIANKTFSRKELLLKAVREIANKTFSREGLRKNNQQEHFQRPTPFLREHDKGSRERMMCYRDRRHLKYF